MNTSDCIKHVHRQHALRLNYCMLLKKKKLNKLNKWQTCVSVPVVWRGHGTYCNGSAKVGVTLSPICRDLFPPLYASITPLQPLTQLGGSQGNKPALVESSVLMWMVVTATACLGCDRKVTQESCQSGGSPGINHSEGQNEDILMHNTK